MSKSGYTWRDGHPQRRADYLAQLTRATFVPACRKCNGSKAARTIIEWRTNRTSPRMTQPLAWEQRKARPLHIQAIRGEQVELFRVCVCGVAYLGRAAYCSSRCHARSDYRTRVGIPLGAAPYEVKANA